VQLVSGTSIECESMSSSQLEQSSEYRKTKNAGHMMCVAIIQASPRRSDATGAYL
jgi:hypothetical protein